MYLYFLESFKENIYYIISINNKYLNKIEEENIMKNNNYLNSKIKKNIYKYIKYVIFIIFIIVLFYFLLKKNKFVEKYENNNKLPKKIFTYWNEVEITNKVVKKNIEYLKKMIPSDFEFTVYNEKTIMDELGEDIKYNNHDMSTPTNFSDFIRYYLIYKYGGVWIDSTYFILDFDRAIMDKYRKYESDEFNAGYYEFGSRSVGTKINEKYYESWFMIAPPQDPYIKDVLDEFKKGSEIGFREYKKGLKKDNINLKGLIEEEDNFYLMIYAMVRKVLTEKPEYKIVAFDISNVLFNYWDISLFDELLDVNAYKKYEAIKLTGSHRGLINENNKEENFLETLDEYYRNRK